MPTTIYLPDQHPDSQTYFAQRSGVSVTWTRSAKRLDISGWYDGCVGIENTGLSLREFFDRLGITEKDCQQAWRSKKGAPNSMRIASA